MNAHGSKSWTSPATSAKRAQGNEQCLFFIDRRSTLPVAHVDDDALGSLELIFIIGRAEIHRPGFRRSRRFHARELLLVVFHGETDMVDAGFAAHPSRER